MYCTEVRADDLSVAGWTVDSLGLDEARDAQADREERRERDPAGLDHPDARRRRETGLRRCPRCPTSSSG